MAETLDKKPKLSHLKNTSIVLNGLKKRKANKPVVETPPIQNNNAEPTDSMIKEAFDKSFMVLNAGIDANNLTNELQAKEQQDIQKSLQSSNQLIGTELNTVAPSTDTNNQTFAPPSRLSQMTEQVKQAPTKTVTGESQDRSISDTIPLYEKPKTIGNATEDNFNSIVSKFSSAKEDFSNGNIGTGTLKGINGILETAFSPLGVVDAIAQQNLVTGKVADGVNWIFENIDKLGEVGLAFNREGIKGFSKALNQIGINIDADFLNSEGWKEFEQLGKTLGTLALGEIGIKQLKTGLKPLANKLGIDTRPTTIKTTETELNKLREVTETGKFNGRDLNMQEMTELMNEISTREKFIKQYDETFVKPKEEIKNEPKAVEEVKPIEIEKFDGYTMRGDIDGDVFTTKTPAEWQTQLNKEGGKNEVANHLYLAVVKEPTSLKDGYTYYGHESVSPAKDVKIVQKIGTARELTDGKDAPVSNYAMDYYREKFAKENNIPLDNVEFHWSKEEIPLSKTTSPTNTVENIPVKEQAYTKYNPDDILPLLKDVENVDATKSQLFENLNLPSDASIESFKSVPIDKISVTDKESNLDRANIEKIKTAIQNGDDVPPVILEFTPVVKNGDSYSFAVNDGHHRLKAYQELGYKEVPAGIITTAEDYTFKTTDKNYKNIFKTNNDIALSEVEKTKGDFQGGNKPIDKETIASQFETINPEIAKTIREADLSPDEIKSLQEVLPKEPIANDLQIGIVESKSELQRIDTQGKNKYQYTDENGDMWEAKASSKSKTSKFDIYKNGEKQSVGANRISDIEQTIEVLKEAEQSANSFEGLQKWEKSGRFGEATQDFRGLQVSIDPYGYQKAGTQKKGYTMTISQKNSDGSLTILKQIQKEGDSFAKGKSEAFNQVKPLVEEQFTKIGEKLSKGEKLNYQEREFYKHFKEPIDKQSNIKPESYNQAVKGKNKPLGSMGDNSKNPIPLNPKEKADFSANDLKNPVRLREIGLNLAKNLNREYGKDIRLGLIKRFKRKALGIFFPDSGIVRVRNINDIGTLSHEIGHYLDYEIFGLQKEVNKSLARELNKYAIQYGKYFTKPEERIAQFVRDYIVDPAKVQSQAPKFYDVFESIINTNEPIKQGLLTAREQYKQFSTQDARQITESTIARDDKQGWLSGIIKSGKEKLSESDLRYSVLDAYKPFKDLTEQLRVKRGVKEIRGADSVYNQVISLIGADGKAQKFLQFGIENKQNAFLNTLDQVIKDNMFKEFEGYLTAKRNIELINRDLKNASTTSKEVAQQTIDLYEKQFGKEKLEKLSKQVYEYNNELLDWYYKNSEGKLSKENLDKIKSQNQFYIPFKRFFDEIESNGTFNTSKILSDTSTSPVKAIRGSLREVVSPLGSVLKNTYDIVVSADKNRVLKKIIETLEEVDKANVQKIPAKVIKQVKVLEDGKIVPEFAVDFVKPENAEIVTLFENGKPNYYQIPKAYYDSFFAFSEPVSKLIKLANIPTRLLQTGAISLEPTFMVRNIPRDQTSALFNSKYGYVPVLDFVKGMMSYVKKDGTYQKFLESGADQSFLTSMDKMVSKNYLERKAGKNLELNSDRLSQLAKRYLRNPLELLEDANRISEIGTRIGAFKRAYAKTGDVFEAMAEGRQISGDYGVKGKEMRQVSLIKAFLNPRLQHLKLLGENVAGQRGSRLLKAGKGLTYITIPSVLNWFVNNSTEENRNAYSELPEWRKYGAWNIKIGGSYLSIPKGFYGTLFGTSVEKFLDWAYYNDKESILTLGKYLFQEGSPIQGLTDLIPDIGRPPIEQFANKNSFSGKPIIPDRLKEVETTQQFTDFTPEIYKMLGEKLNISPLRMEAYFTSTFGGTSRNVANLTDELLRKLGKIPDTNVNPEILGFDMTKLPIFRGLTAEIPRGNRGQSVQKLYRTYEDINKITKTVNLYIANDKTEELNKYLSENKEVYDWYIKNKSAVGQLPKVLSAISQIKNEIAKDNTITDKKSKLIQIDNEVSKLAQQFNKSYETKSEFLVSEFINQLAYQKKIDDKDEAETKKELENSIKGIVPKETKSRDELVNIRTNITKAINEKDKNKYKKQVDILKYLSDKDNKYKEEYERHKRNYEAFNP